MVELQENITEAFLLQIVADNLFSGVVVYRFILEDRMPEAGDATIVSSRFFSSAALLTEPSSFFVYNIL